VTKPAIPENLEEALAQLADLQKQKNSAESEAIRLKATNEGLIRDLKKKKQVDTFLKVAGIELGDDLDEDGIAHAIVSLRTQPQEPQDFPHRRRGAVANPPATGRHQRHRWLQKLQGPQLGATLG
jgi:hypothetical protein